MTDFAERIVHLDMDAFFVEVERLRHPGLVGRAVLVGGLGPRSVVASASYEARQRGVSSGMPMAHARRLVPSAEIVPPNHTAYRAASEAVFETIEDFTPRFEPVSVDEAFVDVGGLRFHYSTPLAATAAMRAAIRKSTGLPSSAGIATIKLVAKMASRDAKPDGVRLVAAGHEAEYLHPKPVRALWGVGEATHARLEELGVVTIGDLAAYPREALVQRLGNSLGSMLWNLANGIDHRGVGGDEQAKSISVEETLDEDLTELVAMERLLLGLADRLASRLRRAGVAALTVSLKARFPDFTTVSRSHTFDQPVVTSAEVFETARLLLGRTAASERGVRLLGIGADGLVDVTAPRQLGFDPGPWEDIDRAVDRVRTRFGAAAVGRAALVEDEQREDDASASS